jgi:hypothetical protein
MECWRPRDKGMGSSGPTSPAGLYAYLDDLIDILTVTLTNLTPSRYMELCQCSYLLQ